MSIISIVQVCKKWIRFLHCFFSGVDCGGTFNGSEGIATSPGYPSNYPENVRCVWTIQIPEGQRIAINITDIELQNSHYYLYDYLEVGHCTWIRVVKAPFESIPLAIKSDCQFQSQYYLHANNVESLQIYERYNTKRIGSRAIVY